MRIALIVFTLLVILGIALTGTHILVERLFILAALVVAFGYLWARMGLWGLKGQILDPAPKSQAGQPLKIESVARNTGWLPKLFLKFQIKSPAGTPGQKTLFNLAPGKSCVWSDPVTFPHRGRFKLGPLVAEATDPFGLFRLHRKLDRGKEVLIYPATLALPYFWAEPRLTNGAARAYRFNNEPEGMVSGIREYVPGDSLSRIHWRSTAHRGKLTVKEFDIDPSEKLWIILDLEQASQSGSGREASGEYGITIAASILNRYIDSGKEVGLIAHGDAYYYSAARPGDLNKWRILETLALCQARGQVPLSKLISRVQGQLNGNSVCVVITASARPELAESVLQAQKTGVRLVVIWLDASSFGGEAGPQDMQNRLQALNVPTYIVKQGEDLAETLNSQGVKLAARYGIKVQYARR
jgi:uncharacterized protein (DUF58 family)